MEQKDTYYVPSLQQTVEAGEFANQRDVEIAALKKLAGKNNNAFIMGMRNLDEPVNISMFDGYLEKKAKEAGMPMGSSAWEATKGFAEGVISAPKKWAGYAASSSLPLIAKSATTLYALSGAAGSVESADKWVREMNKGIEAWAKEMQRITGIDKSGTVENVVGSALGSVWGGVAGGGLSAPMFGLSAAQDTYTRQREEDVGIGEAAARGVWHGTGEWYLEKLQLNRIFGALAKKSKPAAIIKDLLENALQEGAQQANEQLANWNIDNRELADKLQEIGVSMVGGAIASLAGSAGGIILNKKTIDEVGDLMKKTGHSEAEIQKVKENLNKLADPVELEQAAQEVAKDELTTIALTYKEQAQAASEALVQELDDTIARNELVDIGGELTGDKTEGMPPLYQLGELQIDTQKNPHLGMVLYQAEQAGQPMETLAQVFEWTKGKLDTEEAQKLATGIGAVYTKTLEQLKSFGQNEELADKNAHIRAAAAFSLAKNFNMTVEKADEMLGGIIQQKASEFNGQGQAQYQDVAQRINEIDAEEKANGVPEYIAPTININGVERQTKNSSGEPIAKSEKSLRYFYDWFGDSKVVDEQGRPLVVYHGTATQFEVFDKEKSSEATGNFGFYGNGIYTTDSKETADSYAQQAAVQKYGVSMYEKMSYEEAKAGIKEKQITMPLYVSLKNPFVWNDIKTKQQANALSKQVGIKMTFYDSYGEMRRIVDDKKAVKFSDALKNMGYDGVIYNGTNGSEYAAFNPNQIKSTSNRGTFSESDNIYLQSAYAGSRVDYDKPSLEAIGSGEGAQAHGWGLYYALNKDVAERYRDTFVWSEHREKSLFFDEDKLNEEYTKAINSENYDLASVLEELLIQHEETNVLKNEDNMYSKEAIDYYKENIRDRVINKDRITGQVHEVDIPEMPVLLDEEKPFSQQSDFVKEKITNIMNSLPEKYLKEYPKMGIERVMALDFMGGEIYSALAEAYGSAKKASNILEQNGIKGITYDSPQDGRCFVIFNPDDVKVIQKFYQEQAGKPFGAYYNNTIYLFENANESTFVHEMSHAYMDVLEGLAQSGNTKAQKDLGVIRSWLKKKNNEAFTQADWERFARGFEMYIREGKAPNEYLGGKNGVFARFRNWLLGIYGGMKALTVKNEKGKNEPVRINNQIRQFYNEMLGGADIDNVLNNSIENKQAMSVVENKMNELSELQQKLAEERAKLVREMAKQVKPETTWANVKDWGNNLWESITELPKELLKSSSERLAKIDPRLGLLVQRVEQSQGLRLKEWADQLKPFYEAFNKLSADDKAKVQFYLLNQQWGEVSDLLGEESTNAVHDVLESIYQDLIDSGVEVGYRDSYFPRAVLDYDGLLQEMGLTYPSLRKEMEEAIGKDATPQEQAEWLDKHIMGFKGNVSLNKNRNTKERKLDLITPRMAQYYKPSMVTLVDYLNGMAKLLSMREAFGRDIEYKEGNKKNAKDSIGKIINKLFGNNKLTKKENDEVREVLSALYLPNGVGNKFIQAMRQYGYATKLSYSTTVRQFADIGMMMKVNGVLNTLDALFHPDKRLSLETLGIDPLGEEFRTSQKDIGGGMANFFTKWRGINWADAVMKNAFIRGNYKDLQKLAKNSDKFHEKYDRLFGDETETIRQDLLADKVSEPVKVLLFHEISKIQPISRSAMPTAYLNNPNGRVLYMFKTFSLHRAEYMVSELADDFRRGDYKKAGKDIMADVAVIGWEGLVELLIAFLKYGWAALAGEQVLETFAGSGLGVLGLNKHQAVQLAHGKVGDFFREMIGVGTPLDDIGYLIQHYDDDDKLIRAFLPDMIIEPLAVGPKEIK